MSSSKSNSTMKRIDVTTVRANSTPSCCYTVTQKGTTDKVVVQSTTMHSDAKYQKMEATPKATSKATIKSWHAEAEDLPFEWAKMLICHHFVLVLLVFGCSAAPSLDIKACVFAGAVLWIALPRVCMSLEMNETRPWWCPKVGTRKPNKYLVWPQLWPVVDTWRATLGVHRFFVSQDRNGDINPNFKLSPEIDAQESMPNLKGVGARFRLSDRNEVPVTSSDALSRAALKEDDELLGVTGFQAMLGMSMQLHMLYLAVMLFCLGDMFAIGACVALAGGGEAALLDSAPRLLDESLTHLRTATKCLLCAVLLFYALSISVPSRKSAEVHWLRVKAFKRWPNSYAMRTKVNEACFGKIDKTHEQLYSSFLYQAAGIGLPILLEIVVGAGYFCAANEKGCHWPWSYGPFNMLSTVLFLFVGFLTLFALHAWVILEFMRLARCSIFRLQILTQELRVAINKFDDDVYDDARAEAAPSAAKTVAAIFKGSEASERQLVKVHAEKLVKFLRIWHHTRIFMQRHDISFFFKSISAQVGLLILCMACCVVRVLVHHFDIFAFPHGSGVTLVAVGLVGLWCLCIVYFQAYYILQMDVTRQEQLRLLRHLEFSLKSTEPHEEETLKASKLALDVVSFVCNYVSEHDEPPTLLGVRVDPTFISFLHRWVAGTVAAWVISVITNRFK